MPLEPGQNLGHYRIERLIGRGGMGEVYLAEDTRLNRKVALKVLPEEMAYTPDRLARFQREAQAVAALNHPHIVTLYSVEEARGTRFLTMELVEGESLDKALAPGGLPLARVFDIGIALADALGAAHDKGIIHRDLKPANIMLTRDGRVKVLDFGLAKLALGTTEGRPAPGNSGVSEAPTEMAPPDRSLTEAGLVVGTVPYMSPEQVGGEVVDARSDIFSLGAVLYEMATGHRPFGGKNKAETISAILRDPPRPLTEARQDAPRHLSRIIDHCLQKDPEARIQSAKDVRNELRALRNEMASIAGQLGESGATTHAPSGATRRTSVAMAGLLIGLGIVGVIAVAGVILLRGRGQEAPRQTPASGSAESAAVSPDPRSIAVLPFADMSPNKDQEYFSDGISEELLNLLAKVPQLKVAARTSSFSFKGKGVEIPEIARQLRVTHVLEGSIRKSGDQVRITAQLIHATDGFHMWSQTYDRTLDDIFRIQDEIAADVVKELKVTLLGAAPATRTTDPKAYALYLQAMQLGRQATADGFDKSDALLRQVLEIDPGYAPAWSGLATNLTNKAAGGIVPAAEGFARAREMAEKALEIDPDFAPAHSNLGWIAMTFGNDLAGAARHFEHALALDPTNPRVLGNTASFLQNLGRVDEALALAEAQVRLDPVNVTAVFNLGGSQLVVGRFDEAIASCRAALNLSPGRFGAHFCVGTALVLKGDAAGTLAEIEQEKSEIWRMIGLPIAYHALGRKSESDAALAALIAKYGRDGVYNIAYIYAFRGEADKAFEWLDKAVEYGDGGIAEIVTERFFDPIRSNPRWLPFLRKIGRAPEQLARIQFKVALPEGF